MAYERFKMPSKIVPGFDITYVKSDQKNPHHYWPEFKEETFYLKKGYQVEDKFRPIICDIIYKKDVPIKVSDGATLYADMFCPSDESKSYPVIVVWTMYGKIKPPNNYDVYLNRAEMKEKLSCGLNTFEGPEPDYWVSNDYIIVVIDNRGCTHSEGVLNHTGKQEALDIYDAIEWIGTQSWCNGNVGMIGNSQLANSQYNVAALKPPHLKAIAPWEACNDWYRDQICRGGIPGGGLFASIVDLLRVPNGIEDVFTMLNENPLMNDYWAIEKKTSLEKIEIPTYLVASWTSNVHPYGTLRAWANISSKEKWLRIHNTQEWPDQQTPKYRDELRDFYDHYLKGKDNGWENTHKVRVSILDPMGPDRVDIPVEAFPIPDTEYRKLYLDATDRSMSYTKPEKEANSSYSCKPVVMEPEDWQSKRTYNTRIVEGDGLTEYRITFTEDTTLCGYFKAHVFMSTDKSNDMDLFMYVSKEDSIGVKEYPVVLGVDFMGAEARLRVSHRRVKKTDYADWQHYHDKEELLEPGQVVEFETIFWPLGMTWRKGETLVLTVSDHNLQLFEMPTMPFETRNKGNHTIYTGGKYDSYIEIPVVKI